jgi:photosystem II oxygen-evolving enhancer protein 3
LVGDTSAFSESTSYGTDQSTPLYSPYSVYGETGSDSLFTQNSAAYAANKKAILAESRKRLQNLPGYIDKKKWFEVSDELDRYMYETRAAAVWLAKTPTQKKAATDFFKAIEKTDISARLKKQAATAAAATDSLSKLDAFVASL